MGITDRLQREMDSFFKEDIPEEFNIGKITRGGFSQSRKKPSPEAFLELDEIPVRIFINK